MQARGCAQGYDTYVQAAEHNLDVAYPWGKVFASRQLQAAEKIQMISLINCLPHNSDGII
jgi:hypothetical protein